MWASLSSSRRSSTQCEGGRGSFDEDVFSGTEDAHVFSVVLLERPPVVGQRTGFSQGSDSHNLYISNNFLVAWTLMGTACPVLPVFPLTHAGLPAFLGVQTCRLLPLDWGGGQLFSLTDHIGY